MYFTNITLINVGPIEKIKHDFSFHENGNPKPLILVGANGSGKSVFLSHLLNPLMAAQQIAYDDAEVEKGKVYKLRSPQYIRNGETFSYAKVDFASNFSCYEWQLPCSREDYMQKFDEPKIDNSFATIPLHEASIIFPNFLNNPVEISNQFKSNCVLYFPANRFEQPAWLNEYNLNATAEFIDLQKIDRISNRRIIQQSPLITSKNWLLDIAFDTQVYGDSAKMWEAITQLLRLIFKSHENFRFGIGNRKKRFVSVMKNDAEFISNIFQLSTGQTSILNIVLSILRDFDLSGATFEKLEDVRGVVIIDEVDVHLHVDLQYNLLPKVINMFPKVQFILTTHSPLFLLGMKTQFGETGFDILSVPTGRKLGIEEFEEFKSAFDFYTESNTYRQEIELEVMKTQKPIIFVEGEYDVKYLTKAASVIGKEAILHQIDLLDGNGYGNLDKIWKIFDTKLATVLPKIIGLIYDCDTCKSPGDRGMVKKRTIPAIPSSPILKGIENLIPANRIEELVKSQPQFFDYTPEVKKMVGGKPEIQPAKYEINNKKDLCNWICENGTAEDFAHFESVFDLIEEIITPGSAI